MYGESMEPQFKDADGSALRIWKDPAQNNFQSERYGRPVFDEVTYVEVISPGSRGSMPVFELRRVLCQEAGSDEPMYSNEWDRYKTFVKLYDDSELTDATLTGTPINEWAEIKRTFAASLKVNNIFTVEAMANLPDERLQQIGMDGRMWREKARAYLAASANVGHATALAAELERVRIDLAERDKAIADMNARMDIMMAKIGAAETAPASVPPAADPFAALGGTTSALGDTAPTPTPKGKGKSEPIV